MTEITDFAAILLVIGAGVALAVLSTRLTAWVPIPSPAIFLVAAALVSDIWPSLYADAPVLTVERIAVVALIVILFNGGMDIGWRRFRGALAPILSLGVFGTFATARADRSRRDVLGARPARDRGALGRDARG